MQIVNGPPEGVVQLEIHKLKDRFKAMWLAADFKDKQAYPWNQELPTSPDVDPSGPLVSRGLYSDSSTITE